MRIAWSIVAVILLLGSGMILRARSAGEAIGAPTVSQPETIPALGRIEGGTTEIDLLPQSAGCVDEVLVAEGELVEQGDVLLRLDARHVRQDVSLASAELAAAEAQRTRLLNGADLHERQEALALRHAKEAQLRQAQLLWKRVTELGSAKMISPEKVDNQRTLVEGLTAEVAAANARWQLLMATARADELRIADSHIQSARARLELARVRLERMELRAPCHGQVLAIDVEPGEWLGPESTQAAIVLADTTRFRVRAFVEEADAPRVREGMRAEVVAEALSHQRIEGRIVGLSPCMGRKQLWSDHPAERHDTKTRQMWIELPPSAQLVVGLRVDVMIDPNAPVTPAIAGKGV